MSGAPRVRRRIDTLAAAETEALRSAFGALMRSQDPKGNYAFWSGIHGRCCPHRSELFLAWHRAYLFAFEDALRATPDGADVTLPYWDWTVVREIPDLVKHDPLQSDRHPNPDPGKLPTASTIAFILEEPQFKRFGGFGCAPGDKRAPGNLENEHGHVHPWVGPVMARPATAARDPLFWFHHSYVDHLWDRWQQRHQDGPLCLDSGLQGIPGSWTVSDVLDIRSGRLHYDYEAVIRIDARRIRLDPDAGRVELRVPAQDLGDRPRIRFEDVAVLGDGEPPSSIGVHLFTDTMTFGSAISLFGLDGHTDAAMPSGADDCQHDHGPRHFAGALQRLPSGSGRGRMLLTPVWEPTVRPRAGLEVGAVVLGDV